jgi:hypothetical protein
MTARRIFGLNVRLRKVTSKDFIIYTLRQLLLIKKAEKDRICSISGRDKYAIQI